MVEGLLPDLVAATPKMNHVFAATTRQVFDGGVTATVYAVAQCVETISKTDCQSCLTVAYNNIQNCPPEADGSAINMRCFMRYSNTSFFADNQITNIAQYLKGGDLYGLVDIRVFITLGVIMCSQVIMASLYCLIYIKVNHYIIMQGYSWI